MLGLSQIFFYTILLISWLCTHLLSATMCSILSGEFSLMQLRSALSSLSREDRLTGKLGKKISMFLLRVVSSRVFISVRTRAVRAGRGDTSDIHTSLIMTTYNCSHCTGTRVNIALSRFQHHLHLILSYWSRCIHMHSCTCRWSASWLLALCK